MPTLEAGRELDREVAERVFGWVNRTREGAFTRWRHEGRWYIEVDIPNYSTDIAAAWQVVERLDGDLSFRLQRVVGGWLATFLDFKDHTRPRIAGESNAATAPLAICRSALAAVEAQLMPTPEWIEIARVEGPATVRGFDIGIPEHEHVKVRFELDDGRVIMPLDVVGPRALATPPFDDCNRPILELEPSLWITVPEGRSVVLKANRQISGQIWLQGPHAYP